MGFPAGRRSGLANGFGGGGVAEVAEVDIVFDREGCVSFVGVGGGWRCSFGGLCSELVMGGDGWL